MKIKIPSWIMSIFPEEEKPKKSKKDIEHLITKSMDNRQKLKEDSFSKYIPIITSLVVVGILVAVMGLAYNTFKNVNEAVMSSLNTNSTNSTIGVIGGADTFLSLMFSSLLFIICIVFRIRSLPFIVATIAIFVFFGFNIVPFIMVTIILFMTRRIRL